MPTISTLLVANRGEIARRIMRTARLLGMRTVAVYSEPDRDAPFVREADVAVALGGSSASESYLRSEAIIAAAVRSGADAIHPGYGFLSENADFADAVVNAGLIFVGPTPDNIRRMGGKIGAKQIATAAGMPTLPSAQIEGDDQAEWLASAERVGYPVLIKASAGGGGKGMRAVHSPETLVDEVVSARREAASSFGDGTVFVERYLAAPRHIEVQIFGDTHGNVVHLNERECSVQRRHQKIIEEAPSPAVSPELRDRMGSASVALVKSIGYVGAGTVELLLEGDEFFFLEMNTRLQVEHPVTECITGTDLVRWQLEVAQGATLPLTQDRIELRGSAIEVRLYAEDPSNDFLPTFGRLSEYRTGSTPGIRYDGGVESGSEISTFYDPMLGKIISHAPTRREAAGRLQRALREMAIHGVTTNRDYLVEVLGEEDFLAGDTFTSYVGLHSDLLRPTVESSALDSHVAAAVIAGALARRCADSMWSFAPAGWRNLTSQRNLISYESPFSDEPLAVAYAWQGRKNDSVLMSISGSPDLNVRILSVQNETLASGSQRHTLVLEIDSMAETFHVRTEGDTTWVNSSIGQFEFDEVPRFPISSIAAAAGGPTAPVPGRVVAVSVQAGDRVEANQTLVVMEAMKMEHRIEAAVAAVVREVLCVVGDQVDAHQVLVELDAIEG